MCASMDQTIDFIALFHNGRPYLASEFRKAEENEEEKNNKSSNNNNNRRTKSVTTIMIVLQHLDTLQRNVFFSGVCSKEKEKTEKNVSFLFTFEFGLVIFGVKCIRHSKWKFYFIEVRENKHHQ